MPSHRAPRRPIPLDMSELRISVGLPQLLHGDGVDVVHRYAARAEELGFAGLWSLDAVPGAATARVPLLDGLHLLTTAAAVTRAIRLGIAVIVLPARNPAQLARELATIDQLSGGRLIVGVGLGGNPRVYPAYGLTAERRAARFTEGLRLMKRLWTEPRVTMAGEFYRLENASMEPKPRQQPHPPLWFGGHHPQALRRAVELGDGFIGAGAVSTATFADEVRVLRDLLAEAGRASFPIGKRVYLAVDRDRARAAKRLGEWFGAFYGRPELAEQVCVWGDADACVEGLRAVITAGAGFLMLNPVFDEVEQLERLAAEVAPRL